MLEEKNLTRDDFDRAKAKTEVTGRPFMPKTGVSNSRELKRILALPRRVWEDRGDELVDLLTEYLRQPGGTQKLRPVQAAALQEAHDFGGVFSTARVGAGKTLISMLSFVVLESKSPVLIVPAKLVEKTRREMAQLRKHWMVPAWIRIISYEILGREQGARLLLEANPDVLVMDECFVGSTRVTTELGELPIEFVVNSGAGRYALSYDATTGQRVWRKIVRRMRKIRRGGLVKVCHEHGTFVCTPEHKIWTEDGYVEARALSRGDRLQGLCDHDASRVTGQANGGLLHVSVFQGAHEGDTHRVAASTPEETCGGLVRVVLDGVRGSSCATRAGGQETEGAAVLLDTLFSGVDCKDSSEVARAVRGARSSGLSSDEGRSATSTLRAYEKEQSVASPGGRGEDQGSASRGGRVHVPFAGREWHAYKAADVAGIGDRVSDRACHRTLFGARPVSEFAHALQGGSRRHRNEDSDRGGRQDAQDEEVAFPRSAEDRGARVSRVVRVEVLERGGAERSAASSGSDPFVYDLEVEDTHNYFADGVLVSNCHRVRNTRAAVTRRVKHFLAENEKIAEHTRIVPASDGVIYVHVPRLGAKSSDPPETQFYKIPCATQSDAESVARGVRTRVVAMSGTVTKRSMHDYAHITAWCLKKTNPVPEDFNTRMEWSLILDEKRNEQAKLAPGALINLCNDEELEQYRIDPIVTIRRAFRRRLVETPGVVATQEGALGTSLSITSQTLIAPELGPHFFALKKKWERPDGEPIMDALEMWRHLRTLAATGMFYRWNPAPPQMWRDQRKAWARMVRGVLSRGIPGLDSESPIVTAMDRHAAQMKDPLLDPEWKSPFTDEYILPALEELRKWREIRVTFTPETEAVWLSDVQLKAAAKWMQEEKGICWVEHIEFGRKLSELTGVPYYWRGGVNAAGKPIEDHPPGTPLIASIASNSEGRNLQAWFSNYITSAPTTGAALEQLIGRTHRDGQEADEVSVIIPIMIKEQVVQFEGAIRDAKYISQTTGQEQKLCYADMDFVTVQEAPEGF